MCRFLACLCLMLALLVLPAAGQAALRSNMDSLPLEKTYNPRPAADDIFLPMPCGLKLTLRPVAVPAGTFMQDRSFYMGVGNSEDSRRQLYERRFAAHIAAPFSPADLPAAWRDGADKDHTYYFIGKYEISQHQWEAVMNGQCPAAALTGADLPKREVSWHDVQQFLQKYNTWLLQNAADSLPHFAGNERHIGFLRLPTEEEWEYAARGGSSIREEDLLQADIFPLEGHQLSEYGLFSEGTPVHEPAAIGARLPNPLGLYDTVGNVKEMVDGFFRLSVADMRGNGEIYRRLHGAAGGILCKGGSFRSTAAEVLPGWRDELAQFTSQGESRPTDLGFRVVLAGLNIPSGQRLKTLVAESGKGPQNATPPAPAAPAAPAAAPQNQSSREDKKVKLDPEGAPLTELAKIAAATDSPQMQENLAQLRGILEDQQSANERQRAIMHENALRNILYQAETIRSFAYRYHTLNSQLQKFLKNKGVREADVQPVRNTLRQFYDLLLTAANFYKTSLQRLMDMPPVQTERIMRQLEREYSGKDMLSKHMRENLTTLQSHLVRMQKSGPASLSQKDICRSIIPAIHYKVLPFK